jgi:cytochrome c biogenesis protein CcmG/thiol:disulfide interchange protein DsbE
MEVNHATLKKTRKRNIIVFIVTNVLIVCVLALLWTQLTTPKTNPAASTHSADESLVSLGDASSPLLGKPAPDFNLPLLQDGGKKLDLAGFKGKPVVINFWASWCDPCNREAPLLQGSWPDLQAQGVELVGIDGGETASQGIQFIQKYGVTYTSIADTIGGNTSLAYGVTSMPETFFIGRDGKVAARWTGQIDAKSLQMELAKIGVSLN